MDMNQDWREQRRQEREARRQARGQARQMRGSSGYGPNPATGAVVGALLIIGGTLFLLHNAGFDYFGEIGRFWPLILIAIGVTKLVTPRGNHDLIPGGFLLALGGLFLARNLGWLHVNPFVFFWPGILIFVGVTMLMRNLYGPDWWGGANPPRGPMPPADGGPVPPADNDSSERITANIMFGGIHRKVNSHAFEGGQVSATFGGVELDLRDATMKGPQAFLQADALFGGIELKVPDTWLVEVRGSGILGGYDDRTSKPANVMAAPKLIVA